jgi:hypothetical protein
MKQIAFLVFTIGIAIAWIVIAITATGAAETAEAKIGLSSPTSVSQKAVLDSYTAQMGN